MTLPIVYALNVLPGFFRNRRIGGIRFVRIGRLNISFSVSRA